MTTKRASSTPSSPVSIKPANDERTRQSFLEEAHEAWRDFQKTGLHATPVEIDSWVDFLGKVRPKRAPKWHK
jgi:hypothetical protein